MKKFLIVFALVLVGFFGVSAGAISKTQESLISTNCGSIKDKLRAIQKNDSKTRVYLGSYFEAILTKYITPLNVKLVEENLSTPDLIENQNQFATKKQIFANDFTKYQQLLEELIATDCQNHPAEFYEKLDIVRQRRKTMGQDVAELRGLISKHIQLINKIRGKL